jgi:hypothetical protein
MVIQLRDLNDTRDKIGLIETKIHNIINYRINGVNSSDEMRSLTRELYNLRDKLITLKLWCHAEITKTNSSDPMLGDISEQDLKIEQLTFLVNDEIEKWHELHWNDAPRNSIWRDVSSHSRGGKTRRKKRKMRKSRKH